MGAINLTKPSGCLVAIVGMVPIMLFMYGVALVLQQVFMFIEGK